MLIKYSLHFKVTVFLITKSSDELLAFQEVFFAHVEFYGSTCIYCGSISELIEANLIDGVHHLQRM